VCGRKLPEQPLSDWACSEPCQSAWMHHQANPEYPHPRDIRAAAERQQTPPAAAPARAVLGQPVTEGTEINVDGQPFVRVGAHWRPAGMWAPAHDRFPRAVYLRWCPTCQARVDTVLYPASDQQECQACGYHWPGRPLLGWVQARGAPWPGVRQLLSDGQRSATITFTEQEIAAAGDLVMADRMQRGWLRLERQLCGGYADIDQPDERQQRRQGRRLRADWHMCANPS
jgi:hypothetical protein